MSRTRFTLALTFVLRFDGWLAKMYSQFIGLVASCPSGLRSAGKLASLSDGSPLREDKVTATDNVNFWTVNQMLGNTAPPAVIRGEIR